MSKCIHGEEGECISCRMLDSKSPIKIGELAAALVSIRLIPDTEVSFQLGPKNSSGNKFARGIIEIFEKRIDVPYERIDKGDEIIFHNRVSNK